MARRFFYIIASAATMFALSDALEASFRSTHDVVIVDEASQLDITDLRVYDISTLLTKPTLDALPGSNLIEISNSKVLLPVFDTYRVDLVETFIPVCRGPPITGFV